jgi:hypothetical protein
MKTVSTVTIFILLQSSSPLMNNFRRKLQKRLIQYF